MDGMERIGKYEYPKNGLRELLCNIITHRDYGINGSNLIHIFNNKIEFCRGLWHRNSKNVWRENFENIFNLGETATINILNEMLEKDIIEKTGFSKNVLYKLK